VSLPEPISGPAKGTPSDSSQSVPHQNVPYPRKTPTGHLVLWEWKTPTGHLVLWEYYPTTGTQVISISANGSPPLSSGEALLIISKIRESGGLDDSWNCTSIETNIDSRNLRIDGSYSMQLIENVLVKIYQHGYNNARIEIADKRTVPLREIMNLFQSLANNFDGQGIIREVKNIDERVTRCERGISSVIRETTKTRDKPVVKSSQKKQSTPRFMTALEFHKQEVKNASAM
jgi:hypothetical protein